MLIHRTEYVNHVHPIASVVSLILSVMLVMLVMILKMASVLQRLLTVQLVNLDIMEFVIRLVLLVPVHRELSANGFVLLVHGHTTVDVTENVQLNIQPTMPVWKHVLLVHP